MSEDDEQEGVLPEETEVPEEGAGPDDTEWDAFDEIFDDYKPTGKRVIAEDGLPTVADTDASEDDIPPLSLETLVCMGDRSEFVVRDEQGEIARRFRPDEISRKPDGKWYYYPPVTWWTYIWIAFSCLFVFGWFLRKNWRPVQVEPIRPQCKHYVRQVGQMSENPTSKLHYRLCAARRSIEGAFMSVRDTGFWACTLREPRDLISEEKYIEQFDELKVKQGENRVKFSIFGPR